MFFCLLQMPKYWCHEQPLMHCRCHCKMIRHSELKVDWTLIKGTLETGLPIDEFIPLKLEILSTSYHSNSTFRKIPSVSLLPSSCCSSTTWFEIGSLQPPSWLSLTPFKSKLSYKGISNCSTSIGSFRRK